MSEQVSERPRAQFPAAAGPPIPDLGDDLLAPVPEHEELRAVVRALLARHTALDEVRAATGDAAARIEIGPVWRALNQEIGIGGIGIPADRGGAGYGIRELGVLLEECGAALVAAPVLASSVLGAWALLRGGPDLAPDLLTGVVEGRLIATVGPLDRAGETPGTPPGQPSVGARATPATRAAGAAGAAGAAAGEWSVSGTLRAVPHAALADLVITRVSGPDGGLLMVVELPATTPRRSRLGIDASRPLADLTLDGERAWVLADPGRAPAAWEELQTLAGLAAACEHTGMVARLLDLTSDYLRQRTQFGRPVGSFQAVKHRLADLLVERERCRSASRYAAAAFDRDPVAARVPVAVAAAVCVDAVLRAAHECVQLHGGIGFTWEHDAHLYLRRALGDEGLFGSGAGHRARLATLVGLDAKPVAPRR
jgi:alkylation response protein AidB-like acyl-CoA dehydrogenase